MKIQLKDLQNALGRLSWMASKRATLPIFSCVKLEAVSGKLWLLVANMDIYQSVAIPCEGDLVPCCVSLSSLIGAVRGASGDALVALDDDKLKVQCGFTSVLATLPADEFPPFPELDKKRDVGANGGDIADALEAVASFVSTDVTRDALQFISLRTEPKAIIAEAMDGRKAARFNRAIIAASSSACIRPDAASVMLDELRIAGAIYNVDDKFVSARTDGGAVYAALPQYKLPEFKRLFTDDRKPLCSFVVEELLEHVRRCARVCIDLTGETSTGVRLEINQKTITVSSESPIGQAYKAQIAIEEAKFTLSIKLAAGLLASVLAELPGAKAEILAVDEVCHLQIKCGEMDCLIACIRL